MPELSQFLELTQEPTQPHHECLASHIRGGKHRESAAARPTPESQQQQDQQQMDHRVSSSKTNSRWTIDQQQTDHGQVEHVDKTAKRIYRVGFSRSHKNFLKAKLFESGYPN